MKPIIANDHKAELFFLFIQGGLGGRVTNIQNYIPLFSDTT